MLLPVCERAERAVVLVAFRPEAAVPAGALPYGFAVYGLAAWRIAAPGFVRVQDSAGAKSDDDDVRGADGLLLNSAPEPLAKVPSSKPPLSASSIGPLCAMAVYTSNASRS